MTPLPFLVEGKPRVKFPECFDRHGKAQFMRTQSFIGRVIADLGMNKVVQLEAIERGMNE